MFDLYCKDEKRLKMSIQGFTEFVKFYHEKAADHEIDSLRRHFDQTQKGYITREEFVEAFGRNVRE
mgnify:CR=1 FL=1